MIVPYFGPIGGYVVGTEAKTNHPDFEISYDNTEPRHVQIAEMPSEKIVRAIPEDTQTITIYNSTLQSSGEYGYANASVQGITEKELQEQKRYKKLLTSFKQHKGEMLQRKHHNSFEMLAKTLSDYDFTDCFVEFSEYSDMIDFSLLFGNGLELSVGKYFSVEERDVVAYSVSYHGELVISNMIKLGTLKRKFDEILSEID